MNSFQAAAPRARVAISLAAAAMTALTLALSVVAPASMDFETESLTALASSAGGHAPVRVVTARDASQALVNYRSAQPRRKQAS